MRVPFSDWRPDVADQDSEVATVARNVLPGQRSYRPLPAFAPLSAALPLPAIGATFWRKTGGTVLNIAGTGQRLYKLASGAWTNISRTVGGNYTAGAGDFWQFKQYGTIGLATNLRDPVQKFDIEAGANFSALGGTPPNARFLTIVGDQVVLGNLDADRPHGLHWSATNDAESWTPGTGNSDTQIFPDGGHVMGLAGGSVGYVFQQEAIRRMLPRPGSVELFQFDVIEPDHGLRAPRSLVQVGRRIFYLSNSGFFAFSGEGSQAIGVERVDRTFYSRVDIARIDAVVGAADPLSQLVVWLYPTKASPDGFPDAALIYHWGIDRWTEAVVRGSLIVPLVTESITLDGMPAAGYPNLDTLPFSLDAPFWRGGNLLLATFDQANMAAVSSGSAMAATIETAELELNQGQRTFVSGIRPLVETTAATVAVSGRERLGNVAEWSAATAIEDTGECGAHESARYQRFRLEITAGAPWRHALGIDIDAQPDGVR